MSGDQRRHLRGHLLEHWRHSFIISSDVSGEHFGGKLGPSAKQLRLVAGPRGWGLLSNVENSVFSRFNDFFQFLSINLSIKSLFIQFLQR